MNNILQINNLCVSYGKKTVLKDIKMNIEKNSIVSIIGPSGCGKSTFLKSINGMIWNEEDSSVTGEILFNDKNIKNMHEDELRKDIGLVFQSPSPFPFSIMKNMTYAMIYHGISDKSKLKDIAIGKLKTAGLYDEVRYSLNKSALKLSGGQQQRLCIARALTIEPQILMLDEPCSALDINNTEKIESMLKSLKDKYTIIIVTHNLAQAKRISDYTAFFMDGSLIEFGPSSKIFSKPDDIRTEKYIQGIYG